MLDSERHDLFVELLERHQSQLFGYLLALVRNLTDAEDIFQQTCLVLWKKFDQFDVGTSFPRWASTIARLEAMNFLKAKRRSPLRFSEDLHEKLAAVQIDDGEISGPGRTEALANCLEKLVPADRSIVEACYGGESSVREIAQQL